MKILYTLLLSFITFANCLSQTKDVVGPPGSGLFAYKTTVLPNGNFVVTDPFYDNGPIQNVGAVYLYKGDNQTLLSALTGSNENDLIGIEGVTVLPSGNFLIRSPNWNSNNGAVTWGDANSGVSGIVGPGNSLVGTVSHRTAGSIVVLPNGNYVVSSPGDANGTMAFGRGDSGVKGEISGSIALVSDALGGPGNVTVLPNGNFVVLSPTWNQSRGAITWVSGDVGIVGTISAQNSLVGHYPNDQVGFYGISNLANGHFVANNILYNNIESAITWMSGTQPTTGVVSESNSLIGGGFFGSAEPLPNGNYVVFKTASGTHLGSVTLGNGAAGTSGRINEENSLVGADLYGYLTILPNSNFLVSNSNWASGKGAVTFGHGVTGIRGKVSKDNSLVGTTVTDQVGSQFVTVLKNGNYVISSGLWNGNRGALTFGTKDAPVVGEVSAANSLVGANPDDLVGYAPPILLPNGNYVVRSNFKTFGAITLGNGSTGTVGVVSSNNSLVGSHTADGIGSEGIVVLKNGNYVVASGRWYSNRGAVTWGSGVTATTGEISASNSLVGTRTNDYVGYYGARATENGNYVVRSMNWYLYRGAVTWGDGTVGTKGAVSAGNSLVGTAAGDEVGSHGITELKNGKYVVSSHRWNANRGAVTLAGASGFVGEINSQNSLVGNTPEDAVGGDGVTPLPSGHFVVISSGWNGMKGAVTWVNHENGTSGIVGADNSLIGISPEDQIGSSGIIVTPEGNYLAGSYYYNQMRGSITWGNGLTGISGQVNSSNSLVGSQENDNVGHAISAKNGIIFLRNGNFLITNPDFANRRGAITLGSGSNGLSGVVGENISLTGSFEGDRIGISRFGETAIQVLDDGNYVIPSPNWNNGKGAASIFSESEGLKGQINICNSVLGTNSQAQLFNATYNPVYDYLIVGRPHDQIVSVFNRENLPLAGHRDEASQDLKGTGPVPFISPSDCGLLAIVVPGGSNPVQGNVTAKTWIEPAIPLYGSHPFVARHFEIEPENNSSSVTGKITLFFAQPDFDAFNSHPNSVLKLPASPDDEPGKQNLRIAQFHGTSNDGSGLPGSFNGAESVIDPAENDIVWNAQMNRWEVSFNVAGFSNFLIHTTIPALPVTLTDFRAEVLETSVILHWSTTEEINSRGFSIERSRNGKDFITIGFVDAVKTNQVSNKYIFTDDGISILSASRIYYRLKMIDNDETFALSKIVGVAWRNLETVIYPNPSAKSTSIRLQVQKDEKVTIRLINTTGNIVSQQFFQATPTSNYITVPVESLPAGIYVVEIVGESFTDRKQFVKM